MIEIRVTTQAEEDAVLRAHKAGDLDVAGQDYRIARWNGRVWATIAGASHGNVTVTHYAGIAGTNAAGGGGGTGGASGLDPQG